MEPTTWVEVSRAALVANYRSVAAFAGVPVCAVVKGNAYGHGLVETARVFAGAGAPLLAVTRIEEVELLRNAGIATPVLLLTPALDAVGAAPLCEITVTSWSEIEKLPSGARVHLKVDTGMGRIGFLQEDALRAASAVAGKANLVAVWTHFAQSGGKSGKRQLERFLRVRDEIRSSGIKCKFHAANSAATLARPESRLDMVRIGTLLYGENPGRLRAPFPLQDPFAWYARVAAVREIAAGTTVGYGGEWKARRRMRVATLPVGYRDGIDLHPLIRTETLAEAMRMGAILAAVALRIRPTFRYLMFGETRAPIVGRIGMQQITVSLEGLDEISVGSIARIPARRLLVSPDIPRVYI